MARTGKKRKAATAITADTCIALRIDINEALSQTAEIHGLKIEVGRISYTHDNAKIAVLVSVISEDGVAKTPERTDLETQLEFHDDGDMRHLLDRDLAYCAIPGRSGIKCRLVGWKRRASKRPLIVRHLSDGQDYIYTRDFIAKLNRQNPAGPSGAAA